MLLTIKNFLSRVENGSAFIVYYIINSAEDLKMRLMVKLKPVEIKKKRVCPACYAKGEVTDDCPKCRGVGTINSKTIRYNVVSRPIEIVKVDRDPKTGIIRYWENQSEFFYETVIPKLNKYTPEIPFGIHLIHESYEDAFTEADRINKALDDIEVKATKGFVAKPWYVQNIEKSSTDTEIDCLIDKYLEDINKLIVNRG